MPTFNLRDYLAIGKLVALLGAIALLCFQSSQIHKWHGRYDAEHAGRLADRAAFAQTVANYRAAADQARAADKANAERVAAEQRSINERTSNDYEARIADARARAERLRAQASAAQADSGGRGTAPVPGLSAPASGPAQAAGEDRLPARPSEVGTSPGTLGADDALTATEQAIQLDELIKWVRRQAAVDVNGSAASAPPAKP